MHTHQRLAPGLQLAAHQRQMRGVADAVAVNHQLEFALHGFDFTLGDALHQRFGATAVMNEIGDGTDLDAMLLTELDQVRQACHFAVFLQDFTDHRRRRHAGKLREITTRLGMTSAHQHTAVLRLQRENVAGLHDIHGAGVGAYRCLHRARAVRRRNTGGHPLRCFDRHREIGAQRRIVVRHHQRQVQLPAFLFGQRQADQAAAVARHEVDCFRRNKVRGLHEVTLVFAVFFINEDDHFAGPHVGDDFGGSADSHVSS